MLHNIHTSDIVLAAALKVKGFNLDSLEKHGARGIFHFKDIPDEILNDFDLGKLLVDPVAFNNSVKALTTAVRRVI